MLYNICKYLLNRVGKFANQAERSIILMMNLMEPVKIFDFMEQSMNDHIEEIIYEHHYDHSLEQLPPLRDCLSTVIIFEPKHFSESKQVQRIDN